MRIKIVLAAGALILAAGAAPATDFLIEAGGESNLVKFLSTAPMESFEGKTDRISGRLTVDLDELAANLSVEIRVDLASLDTGMQLRNKHMRDNHLETEKFPDAIFRADRIREAPAALFPGQSAEFILLGELSLHGVKQALQVPVSVTCGESEGRVYLDVNGKFEIKLPDYEIKRPKFLVMKLNETQEVSLKLRAWEVAE